MRFARLTTESRRRHAPAPGGVLRAGLAMAGIALVLGGCAVPTASITPVSVTPRIVAAAPQGLQQGKAARLILPAVQWTPDTQLALMPAGPYRTHRLTLASPPVAMLAVDTAAAGQRVFLATADRRLTIVDFPAAGLSSPQASPHTPSSSSPPGKRPSLSDQAQVLSQLDLASPVTQLAHAQDRLLLALADGQLQWWDVAAPIAPRLLGSQRLSGRLLDLQWDGGTAYLLLEQSEGEAQLQRWVWAEATSPRLDRQWSLPVTADAFAVRGSWLWTVGPAGIAVLDIAGGQALLRDALATSGRPDDLQLQGRLALVADGRGGLVLFDIGTPAQLQWRGSYNKHGAIQGLAVAPLDETAGASPGSLTPRGDSALLMLRSGGVLRLGLANPALPSSGAAFRADAPIVFGALQGDAALLATEHSLQRVMMVGDGRGAISSEGLNLGGSRRGAFAEGTDDHILYVADWFSGLHLYDISNPRQLRHLSNYHTPGSSKGVTLLDHYALVGDDDQGLQIIDVEDPHRPRWTAELTPAEMAGLGLAYTMKRVGKTLYLADHRGGFHIIDLTDIRQPRRLGGYDTPGKAWDIEVQGTVAFVADDRAGLLMFDVSDPARPAPFAQFNPGGQAEAVALQDGRAYVAFFDQGLYTLDVRDPRQPQVIGHTPIPGNARGLELGDGVLYVASWEAGLQVVDTRGPAAPRIIGRFDTDGAAWGVKVRGGYAYVLDWWGGIKVVDVRDPARPAYVSRYHARDRLQQMRSRDTYLYAASGAGGLQVYDIKNPLNPIWAKGLEIDGHSQDLWIGDERLYVAAGLGGVAIVDILDPFYSRQIGHITTPGEATRVRAGNEYAYIVDSLAGLLVVDARDPQRPREVARYELPVHDLWLDGQDLWLVTDQGLAQHRLAADGRLTPGAVVPGAFVGVRAQGGLVAASDVSGRISLWRHSAEDRPDGLLALGDYDSADMVTGLWLDADRLYVVGRETGLSVVDIRQPQTPRLIAGYPPTGNHTQVSIARGAAFLAGEARLASVNLLPALTAEPAAGGGVILQLPGDLPLGGYHLLTVGPEGQRQLRPKAIEVGFAAAGQRRFSLDTYRQLLTSPVKPPAEASTDIPAER